MEEPKRPKLFVSHHSSKYEVALHVEKALARHGVDCWIAPRDVGPGEAFDTAIMKAIRDCAGVLLLFCSHSDKSPHVKRELILADSAHKAIIPLRLEEIVPDDLAYHLASAQWIDWLEKRDDSIARIAAKAHQLAGLTPPADAAPAAPAPAPSPSVTAAADDLHAAILSQAAEAPAAAPASVSVRTLIMVGLGLAVAVLAAMLFMRGGDTPKAEVAAATDAPVAATAAPGTGAAAPPASAGPDTQAASPAAPLPDAGPDTAAPADTAGPATARAKIPPTFNCDKAGTNSEKLICASDELAALDREMARAYRQLFNVAVKRRELLATEQRAWRLSVRDACPDEACMTRVMRQRIVVLDERRTEILQNRASAPAAE
ncbi:TIR domain-containing protein [Sphingopyxis sp. BSN-002]|uniref:TIR domain-containing protein n=1 Tax=Sphingopyxis sp. BSN-002 TaxID=2911495 RepID=UPI001EDA2C81|nr:TIR domain-containing protein [Sphingopyxis sp. BSN-002]UKK82848.1 TIR domain-containing protein [Sphingopyxis sp. BSN-002]